MIKIEDIKLSEFCYPVNRIVEFLLKKKLDIVYETIDNDLTYLKLIKEQEEYDFLDEILAVYSNSMLSNSYDTMLTGLEIWLKDHPEYLNKKEKEMIVVKDKKGYDIHFEYDSDGEPALIIVSNGEDKVTFSPEYCFQPVVELIEDFERTIDYKNSL